MRFINFIAADCGLYQTVYFLTKLLNSAKTCCLGLMVNVNILKKEAAGFFRSLTDTKRVESVKIHKLKGEFFLDQNSVMRKF